MSVIVAIYLSLLKPCAFTFQMLWISDFDFALVVFFLSDSSLGGAMKILIKTVKGKIINLEVEDSSETIDIKIRGEPDPSTGFGSGSSGFGSR